MFEIDTFGKFPNFSAKVTNKLNKTDNHNMYQYKSGNQFVFQTRNAYHKALRAA